jgi:hypothetical protein
MTALMLSACTWFPSWLGGGRKEDKFVKCPDVEMLEEGRNWIDTPGDGWKARAQISQYDAQCKVDKDKVELTVTPKIQVERSGDVTDSMKQELPLFLTVMRGDDIIEKKIFTDKIKFGSGKKTADDDFDMEIDLPLIKPLDDGADKPSDDKATTDDKDKSDSDDKDKDDQAKKDAEDKKKEEAERKKKDPGTASDRTVYLSFQLDDDQLKYFRDLREAQAKAALTPPAAAPVPATK